MTRIQRTLHQNPQNCSDSFSSGSILTRSHQDGANKDGLNELPFSSQCTWMKSHRCKMTSVLEPNCHKRTRKECTNKVLLACCMKMSYESLARLSRHTRQVVEMAKRCAPSHPAWSLFLLAHKESLSTTHNAVILDSTCSCTCTAGSLTATRSALHLQVRSFGRLAEQSVLLPSWCSPTCHTVQHSTVSIGAARRALSWRTFRSNGDTKSSIEVAVCSLRGSRRWTTVALDTVIFLSVTKNAKSGANRSSTQCAPNGA